MMFKNHKETASVLVVALMLTAGVGLIMFEEEGSEAVTTQTPLSYLDVNGRQAYTDYLNGQNTHTVGFHTYIDVTPTVGSDYEYRPHSLTTTYDDNAGLTLNKSGGFVSNWYVRGYVSHETGGTITIGMQYEDEGGTVTDYTIILNVVDVTSSMANQYTALNLPANVFAEYGTWGGDVPYYVAIGSTVNVQGSWYTTSVGGEDYSVSSVTAGFGLTASSYNLTGTITQAGTITVEIDHILDQDDEVIEVTIIAVDNNTHDYIRMIGGETWTYTPSTNIASVISVSGTATAWVSLTGGTVSGTAPSNTSVGQTYELTITASTTQPVQTVTQTVSFTVDPQITITVSNASQSIIYGAGSVDIISSNFEDGTRSIYSLTGTTGYSVNAVNGVISYTAPNSGSVTITATSPYTYTSGATNSASTSVTFDVAGRLSASVSGILYLVTGKTVPNTLAEAVTLSHNDVGAGTYTWSIVGTNNSGVTVASDGTIGGSPGDIGTYTLTVTCTSVVGGTTQTADATLNVVIVAVLVFTSTPSQGTIV